MRSYRSVFLRLASVTVEGLDDLLSQLEQQPDDERTRALRQATEELWHEVQALCAEFELDRDTRERLQSRP